MDLITSNFAFAKALQVDRVSVVSLGGIHGSDRLFDIIKETGGYFVLLLERDRINEQWVEQHGKQIGIPIIRLNPSVLGLFNLQPLREFVGLESVEPVPDLKQSNVDNAFYKDAEVRLRRAGFGRSHNRTMQMIDMFINTQAVKLLSDELRAVMDKLRENKANAK